MALDLDLGEVDIGEVQARLTWWAIRMFSGIAALPAEGLIQGLGVGPEDLAMGSLLKLLDPTDATVSWSASKGRPTTLGIVGFLKQVMKNDLKDLLREGAHKTTVIVDSTPKESDESDGARRTMSLDDFASTWELQDEIVIRAELHAQLLNRFEDDPEAKDVLALQLDPDGYAAHTNQQAAALLDTTVADIENRKKRVATRLARILGEKLTTAKTEAHHG